MPFGPAQSYLAICEDCRKRIQRTAFKSEDAIDYMKEQGWHIRLHATLCHPCYMGDRAWRHKEWSTWIDSGNNPHDIVAFWTWVVDSDR